jgi:hypothetical protein
VPCRPRATPSSATGVALCACRVFVKGNRIVSASR